MVKQFEKRNEVYDQLIAHFKEKIKNNSESNTSQNKWLMETYDNEVKKADRGDAYRFENLMAYGFGGLSVGLMTGGIALDQPVAIVGAAAFAGASIYNYIRFKRLSLGRGLGTRMFYAETLQKIIEENSFKYPFNSGEMEDYDKVQDYVEVLKESGMEGYYGK